MSNCIFEYCNYGKGYLRVVMPALNKDPAKELFIELDDYLLENGVIKNAEAMANHIRTELDIHKFPQIELLLRCKETHKSLLSLPVMSKGQAEKLYKREQKARGAKEGYVTVSNMCRHSLGYIFSTYYMPMKIIHSFKLIAKVLGTKIAQVLPYGFYLQSTLPYHGDYVYFDIKNDVCTMISVSGKNLLSAYDFTYETVDDIVKQFLLVITKHEFELEHKPITHYGVSAGAPVELELELERIEQSAQASAPKKEKGKKEKREKKADGEKTEKKEKKPLFGSRRKAAPVPKAEQVVAAAPVVETLQIEEEGEPDVTTFRQRYNAASESARQRIRAISSALLAYEGIQCKENDICMSFYGDRRTYAQVDIRDNCVCLYLAADPEKYLGTRYQSMLSKKAAFAATPCLYKILTGFRQEGAYHLIAEIAALYGFVEKNTGGQR